MRALEPRSPALFRAIEEAQLRRGYRSFEHFLERLAGDGTRLERLETDERLAAQTLDLFEHSPHFGEELIRTPELLDEIGCPPDYASAPHEAAELRRWYRRQMLRIQSRSICGAEPIFETLTHTSELADAVIARAYEITAGEAATAGDLRVIALGRLGMREFDLASDADLVFVLADSAAAQMPFWTRVAEKIIDLLTAYTGDGMLFAVDTRLRPNGGSGPLVQTESSVKEYFASKAEAWEGITYMKSRAIVCSGADGAERAEAFLHQLQEIDWRRYGQGGRSRAELRQMRLKLEKEQGASHPLKAGKGGYYDIDFLLMYLRLKSAGFFFKVLNTPARIEVLENMGHLDRDEARLLQAAATFYRALDHGLRVQSGHAEGKLPASEAQLELLGAVLQRWTEIPLSGLREIREQTRAMFDRVFQ
jgi:glutamate-ammonia-ligase adenylyltransferase